LREEVSFVYEKKMIVVGKFEDILQNAKTLEDLRTITEENFFDL
jgi:hypothetical protein